MITSYCHCAEKIVSACWCAGSVLAERVGQGEVGGVTRRVLCTWQLLGLAIKGPWLALGRPILGLAAWASLENTTLTLQGVHFWQRRLLGLYRSGCLPIKNADYCMLVNEWAWLMSRVCLLRLEVVLASVLESELGQKWRYGALKACMG